jgi:hypothetical protein
MGSPLDGERVVPGLALAAWTTKMAQVLGGPTYDARPETGGCREFRSSSTGEQPRMTEQAAKSEIVSRPTGHRLPDRSLH